MSSDTWHTFGLILRHTRHTSHPIPHCDRPHAAGHVASPPCVKDHLDSLWTRLGCHGAL
jgi:hypothetical protein